MLICRENSGGMHHKEKIHGMHLLLHGIFSSRLDKFKVTRGKNDAVNECVTREHPQYLSISA